MPLSIIRQDITQMNTDAIVAAEGHCLSHHGWVGSAIAEAAGPEYQKACDEIGHINTGDAVATNGYLLPCKYVIHTVGPKYEDGHRGEDILLKTCYDKCLKVAKDKGCKSIAFPVISTGGFGFPKKEALEIAIGAITNYLEDNDMEVYLLVYDEETTLISKQLSEDIREYLDDFFEGSYTVRSNKAAYNRPVEGLRIPEVLSSECMPDVICGAPSNLDDYVKKQDESFHDMLFRIIEEKGLKNSEVYTKANISKSHFSKMKNDKDCKPKKETVFAFAIALKLSMDETEELLNRAGFTNSNSFKLDLIVSYFIEHKIYDIFAINEVLYDYDQVLLGEKAI